ncbi:hypothetical protein [Agrococcus sp. KRD186]|uniref:hypothetical protein n=1 Tax=Agrococcus sp. KRD186 TaxID=2729730 RepID=UPI0019D1EFC1|nr:hypothetical protein [Agrococcus sp. KRD186]
MTGDRRASDGAAGAHQVAGAAEAADSEPTRADKTARAAEPAGADELIEDAPAPMVIRRRGRRVSTEPSPGYTGEPPTERQQSSENDARLWGDLPPHWGKR